MMQAGRLPLCVVALALLAATPLLRATTVIQPTFDRLVGTSTMWFA